jgi:Rrf2 family nitric oxide-sensitive transcriptional repressor
MRLTRFTDNALRALIYLGLRDRGPIPSAEIARRMGMSEDHLVKVMQRLAHLGIVQTVRGRRGGVRLARAPQQINIGQVVRATEESLQLVDCLHGADCDCPIGPVCVLNNALTDSLAGFFAPLDRLTLADLLAPRQQLQSLLREDTNGVHEPAASGAPVVPPLEEVAVAGPPALRPNGAAARIVLGNDRPLGIATLDASAREQRSR